MQHQRSLLVAIQIDAYNKYKQIVGVPISTCWNAINLPCPRSFVKELTLELINLAPAGIQLRKIQAFRNDICEHLESINFCSPRRQYINNTTLLPGFHRGRRALIATMAHFMGPNPAPPLNVSCRQPGSADWQCCAIPTGNHPAAQKWSRC